MISSSNPGLPDIISSIQLFPVFESATHLALTLDVIRSVVRALRFDHPSTAIRLAWSAEPPSPETAIFTYDVPSSEHDIQLWLPEVVFDRRDVLVAANGNMDNAIQMVERELGQEQSFNKSAFIIHHIPPSLGSARDAPHGFVFLLTHAVFDGIGTFQFMNIFASKIATLLSNNGDVGSLPWGEEISRLAPVHEESTSQLSSRLQRPRFRTIVLSRNGSSNR